MDTSHTCIHVHTYATHTHICRHIHTYTNTLTICKIDNNKRIYNTIPQHHLLLFLKYEIKYTTNVLHFCTLLLLHNKLIILSTVSIVKF